MQRAHKKERDKGTTNTLKEEKRAELERYRYDEEVLKQQMNKIDQSIEFRVSQMIGSRVGM
jgi:hypothetical protein